MTDKFWLCKDCGRRPTYFHEAQLICNFCDSTNLEEVPDPGELLHIHGVESWHGDAFIIGNQPALKQLMWAIQRALNNKDDRVEMYCNDGEGFILHIMCRETEWDERAVPYTNEIATEKRDEAVWPWGKKKEEEEKSGSQ